MLSYPLYSLASVTPHHLVSPGRLALLVFHQLHLLYLSLKCGHPGLSPRFSTQLCASASLSRPMAPGSTPLHTITTSIPLAQVAPPSCLLETSTQLPLRHLKVDVPFSFFKTTLPLASLPQIIHCWLLSCPRHNPLSPHQVLSILLPKYFQICPFLSIPCCHQPGSG